MEARLIGRPCLGCGFCCKTARCSVSYQAEDDCPELAVGMSSGETCPFLYHDGIQWRCKLSGMYRVALAIGAGCCSPLNTKRKEAEDGVQSKVHDHV